MIVEVIRSCGGCFATRGKHQQPQKIVLPTPLKQLAVGVTEENEASNSANRREISWAIEIQLKLAIKKSVLITRVTRVGKLLALANECLAFLFSLSLSINYYLSLH
jgi:hypothetical protein